MDLLLVIAVVFVWYQVARWMKKKEKQKYANLHPKQQVDELIQDPVCKVYFPKKQGVPLAVNGKSVYFCSTACRNAYLDRQKHAKEV